MNRKITVGGIETISIPALGVKNVEAKVDTGAWSGALHCTNIVEKDGLLSFCPLGDTSLRRSVSDYETRTVRDAGGNEQTRYIVPIELEIAGQTYHTTVGLSDRTTMKYELLIGRRFLILNDILVDVSMSVDKDYEAGLHL